MSSQQMWESRYRDGEGHTPDGVSPHPVVVAEAESVLARSPAADSPTAHSPAAQAPQAQQKAADLGSGAGRHALTLAELGAAVTAVDFAASAHDHLQREAVQRGVAQLITPVVADVGSWEPAEAGTFDVVVAAYLHSDLAVLTHSAGLLAPGGRLIWIAHAPDSEHGPPPEIVRDTLASHREQLASLQPDQYRILRAEEYRLSDEFLDIIVVVERL